MNEERIFTEYTNATRAKEAFEKLFSLNLADKIEKKQNLSYLSWAYAWGEVKKVDAQAMYTIYEDNYGNFYHNDGKTCWVKTGVTIFGLEYIEYLPVMDYKNNAIPVDKVTSFDVNKAIQRSLTKAAARHGLGLYIYAGEDLPEGEEEKKPTSAGKKTSTKKEAPAPKEEKKVYKCDVCGGEITNEAYALKTFEKWQKYVCPECVSKKKKAYEEAEAKKKAAEEQKAAEAELPFPLE